MTYASGLIGYGGKSRMKTIDIAFYKAEMQVANIFPQKHPFPVWDFTQKNPKIYILGVVDLLLFEYKVLPTSDQTDSC